MGKRLKKAKQTTKVQKSFLNVVKKDWWINETNSSPMNFFKKKPKEFFIY